ncbi:hypothetical protein LUZ60_000767 [Juncus effusus]|nr:hypothetical protein LUZ60_000767 [Juncus effusus]
MSRGLIWATTDDLAKNKPIVLSLYRQILRSLNSPDLPLTHAARLAKKAEVRSIFIFGAEEKSVHNIADLISRKIQNGLETPKNICFDKV